jgi:lipopolysaccharide biosynthesis glycosyltransferase
VLILYWCLFQGKFGQRECLTQVEYVHTTERFNELIFSDNLYSVINHSILTDDIAYVVYKNLHNKPNPKANIFIAAFTTAHARLHLYDAVQKLDDRVLYMDTDSVVFTSVPNSDNWVPELDNYLGGWTDEVKGDQITKFTTCGPKNYACETYNSRKGVTTSTMKIKGVRQTMKTSAILTPGTLNEQVDLYTNKKRNHSQEGEEEAPNYTIKRRCLVVQQTHHVNERIKVNIYYFVI